jgi:hypothetical protein
MSKERQSIIIDDRTVFDFGFDFSKSAEENIGPYKKYLLAHGETEASSEKLVQEYLDGISKAGTIS